MAVASKLRSLLRDKKGHEAVSFLLTTAMLIFIFAALVSALIFIMQYYLQYIKLFVSIRHN